MIDADDLVIEVRDQDRIRRAVLVGADLQGTQIVPHWNEPGDWTISLPGSYAGEEVSAAHWLAQPGAGIIARLPGGMVVSGTVEAPSREIATETPEGRLTFTGKTDMQILAWDHAWPVPGASITGQTTATNDVRTGPAETLLHAYVGANIGPGTPRARVELGADLGRGNTMTKRPRFDLLLDLAREIAGTELCFDIVQDGTDLRFITWEPADRTIDVMLDIETGALSSLTVASTAPTVTRAVVLGGGEGTARTMRLVTTPEALAAEAIWGARTVVLDQSGTTVAAELDKAGLEAIAEGMATTSSAAVPADDGDIADLRPGDWVTVMNGDAPLVAQVQAVPHIVTENGLLIGATIGEPVSGRDAVLRSLQRSQESLERRLARLERGR